MSMQNNQRQYSNTNRRGNNPPDNALAVVTPETKSGQLAKALGMPPEYVQLVKDICAKGATDEEFVLFLQVVHDTGLNPLTKEIWFYKMYDSNAGRDLPVIHASIQGLRKAADKMGGYMPGKETTYEYDLEGKLLSATAYVKRFAGEWHEISFTAYWAEFGKDVNKWKTMPKHMLGKCAETHALKRAFPRLDSLIETDMILPSVPPPIFDNPPADTPKEIEKGEDAAEETRRREMIVDDLDAMAEMLLPPDELAKLRAWTEDATLDALMDKFHNALSRFTQYVRGIYDGLPEEYQASSLEEFGVSNFEEMSLDVLIRYGKTYKDGIGSDSPE